MTFTTPSSPVRLTATATQKLPRLTLWILCIAYILPGLFGRDPWKSDDVISIGTMLTAYHGSWSQWLLPESYGIAVAEGGPLLTWMGAASMVVFSPIFEPITAARILQIAVFWLTCASIWYGTFLLARRQELQPTALPFGGQPSSTNYGRMIADATLLLFLATLGLVLKHHESSPMGLIMTAHALFFYGTARSIDRPISGLCVIGISWIIGFFSFGLPGWLPLALSYIAIFLFRSSMYRQSRFWLILPLVIFLLPVTLWLYILTSYSGHTYWLSSWIHWNSTYFGILAADHLVFILKNMPWFLWPSFPLALYTLWRWYAYKHFVYLQIAGGMFFSAVVFLIATPYSHDPQGIAFIIPCILLGSLALPVLKKSLLNALDWFSVMTFSFILLLMWFGWFAVMTGFPPKVAENFAKQTVGFTFSFSWWVLIAGLLITVLWVFTVWWRIHTRPSELWRGTVLSATGIVMSWLLLTTFFLPAVDYGKSYRSVANEIQQVLAQETYNCIQGYGVGSAQRASLAIFANISLKYSNQCTLALLQTNRDQIADILLQPKYNTGTILWQGHRPADRKERLILLKMPAHAD